jgi:hypothetical protein
MTPPVKGNRRTNLVTHPFVDQGESQGRKADLCCAD